MEQGFVLQLTRCTAIQGWVLVQRGQEEEGIAQIRQGLHAQRAVGAENLLSQVLAWLAEAYRRAEDAEAGLRVLAEALTLVTTTGGRVYEAELYRLKGELLLQQAPPDAVQAEVCFQQALDVSRHQQAKSWELRAAMARPRVNAASALRGSLVGPPAACLGCCGPGGRAPWRRVRGRRGPCSGA